MRICKLIKKNQADTLRKKWSFPLRISSVNVTKSLMENFIFCAVTGGGEDKDDGREDNVIIKSSLLAFLFLQSLKIF